MSDRSATALDYRQTVISLRRHRGLWLWPTLSCTLLAAFFAQVRTPQWQATQALLVRNEAIGSLSHPGEFVDTDSRKKAQETVLELAKGPKLLAAALAQVGPPAEYRHPAAWPTPRDVEDVGEAVSIKAPKGAEFGQSDVFYLIVRQDDPQRAASLASSVCGQLDLRLRALRDLKARSTIDELEKTAHLAEGELQAATAQLAGIETQVGGDLIELRSLSEVASGDTNLRRTLTEINNELRQAKNARDAQQQLVALVRDAMVDPVQLVAMPSALLDIQPSLRRLKDGLVDAQLQSAQLQGRMTADHPDVQAALTAEQEIRRHLYRELDSALRGLQAELSLSSSRVASLTEQRERLQTRLNRLVELRADHNNLVAQVRNRGEILRKAQENLADARASLAAAHSARLITELDEPTVGTRPLGPGRAVIVLAGLFGGLATGLGLVALKVSARTTAFSVAPATQQQNGAAGADASADISSERRLTLKQALQRLAQKTPSQN